MKKYPITLKEAKRICKLRIGHLPRAGRSVVVGGVFTRDSVYPQFRTWDYQLSLENYAGKLVLREWFRPFYNADLSTFQSLENERDGRV